jgi:hypothetical protein
MRQLCRLGDPAAQFIENGGKSGIIGASKRELALTAPTKAAQFWPAFLRRIKISTRATNLGGLRNEQE